ncbi:MAG: acyl-CoA dehydrogenase family protein, partial [Quisquiliibacterium sp.]
MNGPEYLLDSASAGAQGEPGAFMLTDELLARVALLAPQIAQAAGAIDAERRFPPELIDAFHNAQLFRILIPRRYGGLQAHPLAFMRTLEELAKLDASAAWIVGQNSVCAIVSAYLAPEVARPVFGDPRSVLAWGPQTGPARIQACDGGYRVTGKWSFASGMRQATWLGCQATVHESDGSPRLDAQGRHVKRVMLIPASVAKVEDIWDVIGLRGTASDAYSVEN